MFKGTLCICIQTEFFSAGSWLLVVLVWILLLFTYLWRRDHIPQEGVQQSQVCMCQGIKHDSACCSRKRNRGAVVRFGSHQSGLLSRDPCISKFFLSTTITTNSTTVIRKQFKRDTSTFIYFIAAIKICFPYQLTKVKVQFFHSTVKTVKVLKTFQFFKR